MATLCSKPYIQPLIDKIKSVQKVDQECQILKIYLQDQSSPGNKHPSAKNFQLIDNILYHQNQVYVPCHDLQLEILKSQHDSIVAGHFGTAKTINAMKRVFWWPRLVSSMKNYAKTCDICNHFKTPKH